jgi:hypothetical protein
MLRAKLQSVHLHAEDSIVITSTLPMNKRLMAKVEFS